MKISSAHQPAFLPWLGLLHKLMLADKFIFMDIAKFRKRAFMHRNSIEINNKKSYVGLKVDNQSDFLTCDKVKISANHELIIVEIRNKLILNYKNFPFFKDLKNFIDECLDENDLLLNSLCFKQLLYFKKKLDLNTEVILESDLLKNVQLDGLNATERLLHHAKITNSNIYITGINSINYLDQERFKKNNVYNYVQKFDYTPFLKYQNISEPLSVVHQIAKIGIENIKNILAVSQVNKQKLLEEIDKYDRS